MTPDRLRECLDIIGWSQHDLSDALGIDDRTVRLYWAMGRKPVPENVAAWLEELAALHLTRPAGWTRHPKHRRAA